MHTLTLAVTWQPFLRGIVVVLIGVAVLIGSVYIVLGTNLGARLGFMVVMAALFGWIALMSATWWMYGTGLKGKDPSWQPVAVFNDSTLLVNNNIIGNDDVTAATETSGVNGWHLLASDAGERSQAIAASDDILQNQAKVFAAGDYLSLRVWDKGGERSPKFGPIDFFAFWHQPHYALVEVQPVIKQNTEPGKAPPTPVVDPNAPKRYVLMERNLGNRRRPPALIFLGSTIIFLWLCRSLHRREKLARAHREETGQSLEPVGTGV
jgi:hypothetical protein